MWLKVNTCRKSNTFCANGQGKRQLFDKFLTVCPLAYVAPRHGHVSGPLAQKMTANCPRQPFFTFSVAAQPKKTPTFAAVKRQVRRHIAAWVLLAVIVPIYLIASLHVHDSMQRDGGDVCQECVQHHCSGHLVQFSGPTLTCVLCQFLSLTFVAASLGVAVYINKVYGTFAAGRQRNPYAAVCGTPLLRAPPSV